MFKNNDELFYKYAYQNFEILKVVDTNFLDGYIAKISNATYKGTGKLTVKTQNNNHENSDTDQFDTLVNNFSLTYDTQSNLPEKKIYIDAKLNYNNEEQFETKFVKTGDLYGIKSDEVVNKYLALDNNELKEVFTKMGSKDVSIIPNKIGKIDYNSIVKMDSEEKSRIINKYQNVLESQIPKNHYEKQENVNIKVNNQNILANGYKIKLSSTEYLTIKTRMLETLMNDDETLNMINKLIQMDDSFVIKIKEKLQDKINELKKANPDDNDTLTITVYESNRKLVKTEVETDSDIYEIENNYTDNNQKVTIEKTNKKDSSKVTNTIIERKTTDSENSLSIESSTKEDDKEINKFVANIAINGSLNSDKLDTTLEIGTNANNKIDQIKYADKKEFDVDITPEELTDDNSATINDMTLENVNNLNSSIKERLKYLYDSKITALGFNPEDVNYQAILKWSRIVDVFDEDEFKMQVQRALNLAKEDLSNKEELKQQLQGADGDEDKIKQIKGVVTVERLRETGLDAYLNTDDNNIIIKSNNESKHQYIIDYDNFKISRSIMD